MVDLIIQFFYIRMVEFFIIQFIFKFVIQFQFQQRRVRSHNHCAGFDLDMRHAGRHSRSKQWNTGF